MLNEPLDYVRSAIPEASLVAAGGGTVALTRLAQERAALLIFPGLPGDQQDATLRTIAGWPQRMPLVDFVLVVRDLEAERDELAVYADRVLGDPQGKVQALFGASGLAAAVLLGTDGLLAGGPALGAAAIDELVQGIAGELAAAYGETMRPGTAIVIATHGSAGFVALQLESAIRHAPGVPVLIHDDHSQDPDLPKLAARYGAQLASTPDRYGHAAGDIAAYSLGLRWAANLGVGYLVKISRRCIPITPWLEQFVQAATAPTVGNPDSMFGWRLRTEFVGLRVADWLPRTDDIAAYRAGHVEDHMADIADALGPTAPFDWLGPSRATPNPNLLWYNTTTPADYATTAIGWGLTPGHYDTRPNLHT